jgi:hypothetical protein
MAGADCISVALNGDNLLIIHGIRRFVSLFLEDAGSLLEEGIPLVDNGGREAAHHALDRMLSGRYK